MTCSLPALDSLFVVMVWKEQERAAGECWLLITRSAPQGMQRGVRVNLSNSTQVVNQTTTTLYIQHRSKSSLSTQAKGQGKTPETSRRFQRRPLPAKEALAGFHSFSCLTSSLVARVSFVSKTRRVRI